MIFKPIRHELSDHNLLGTSLQNVKDHLRITTPDEDNLLTEYIKASTERLERWLGMNFKLGKNLNIYEYCNSCATGYLIRRRPFVEMEKLEYLKDSVYTEEPESDLIIQEKDLETVICLTETLNADCEAADPIRIEYYLGFTREALVDTLTRTGTTAKMNTVADHGQAVGDHVLISGADQAEYNGYHEITNVPNVTSFEFEVTGTPASPATGTITLLVSDVPPLIQLGIKNMAAKMYANRGDCADKCGDVPCNVQNLLGSYRKRIIRTTGTKYGCVCC